MSIFADIAAKNRTPATTGIPHSVPRAVPSVAEAVASGDPGAVSCVGVGMKIVGQVTSEGVVHVFGRMEGELRASSALISDAAHFEGKIIAQELTICGHVKGAIHATRVKLESSAVVQGDIFHRSLAIEENAQFEGRSRRQENPTEAPSSIEEDAPKLQPQTESAEA